MNACSISKRILFIVAALLPWAGSFPAVASPVAKVSAATPTQQAPLDTLVARVDIPYDSFTLPNGLRVIVHTDRKAPVVGVTLYYRVGSKHEPKGKSGFAHLFEHLMFSGSENVPEFDAPLIAAGAKGMNGSTWYDRTNYVVTVPTGALDRALFIEADRMGRLLGAMTQAKLDAQRGVVQNEKRQGDNQPFGLVDYAVTEALFPPGHPYGHDPIGSMADLDAASLDDVRQWFRDSYGPNNAVLALAGDIDLATAKEKVSRYFGAIPAGPAVSPVSAPIPTLPARIDAAMRDRVAQTRLYRVWTGPGLNASDAVDLAMGLSVLGGLASSRLDNALVRREQLAVRASASAVRYEQLGMVEVTVDVKPGVDPALVSKRLDELIAELLRDGPTADEVSRVATQTLSGEIKGLENVGGFGGKAATLAEGLLYAGDPGRYRTELGQIAAATPDSIASALRRWLSRPVYALTVSPGERDAYIESQSATKAGEKADVVIAAADDAVPPPPGAKGGDPLPPLAVNPPVDFPDVETRTLSNGIKVHFARRSVIPTVQIAMSFDAGTAAETREQSGIGRLTLALLEAGTRTRDSIALAEAQERLGADISTIQSVDRTMIGLSALTINLEPSLDLLADVIRNPAFAPEEVERLRAIQLAAIDAEQTQPTGLASREIYPLLYGDAHPYGMPARGLGDGTTVRALTRNDLAAYQRQWLRPERAEIFVAGDFDQARLLPLLERHFGRWPTTRDMPRPKRLSAPLPSASPEILLIHRPQSPQSVIVGGFVTPVTTTDDLTEFEIANRIFGDDFTSRLNTEIREERAWSYGVSAYLSQRVGPSPYLIVAPVQADKTGAAISAMRDNMRRFTGPQGVTSAEFDRIVGGAIASLPGRFETTGSVLGQMRDDAMSGRPFDFVETLAARYRALTPAQLDAAARAVLDPSRLKWVVVGDAAQVRPQLEALGLPLRVIDSAAVAQQNQPVP